MGRDGGVAGNHLRAHAAERLDTERKRGDVQKHDVLDGSAKNTALNGGAHGDDLIRVHALHRLLAEHLLHRFLHGRDSGRATDQNDLVDVVDGQTSITQGVLHGDAAAVDQVGSHRLEMSPGQIHLQVERAVVLVGDERQADGVVHRAGQRDLRLFGFFLHSLQGHGVLLQVDAVLGLELASHPIDDLRVEVITTEVGVAVRALHFEHAVAELQDGHIERAAAEVVHGDLLFLVRLVQTIGQSGSGRLVDDALHVKAGDLAGILRGLALGVVEIGRHRDDGLGDRLLQVGFGGFLHLLEDGGGNLLGGVDLAPGLDTDIALAVAGHFIRKAADLVLHFRVLVLMAHETLDGINGVLGVRDHLVLRRLAHETLALFGERHDGRRGACAIRIDDDMGLVALHHRDTTVRRAQVNSYDLSHICISSR